jgi:hypothetical protein
VIIIYDNLNSIRESTFSEISVKSISFDPIVNIS